MRRRIQAVLHHPMDEGRMGTQDLFVREGLHNLLRERIAALRGVGFGRFASHRLRRCEPTPKLRFRSLA